MEHSFAVGDKVFRRTNVLSDADRGIAKSLARPFEGPFLISGQLAKNSFSLETTDGLPAGNRNADQLRPCWEQPDWAVGVGRGDPAGELSEVLIEPEVVLLPPDRSDTAGKVQDPGKKPEDGLHTDTVLSDQSNSAPASGGFSETVTIAGRPKRIRAPPVWAKDFVV
jgi:hypothetical protein